MINWHWVYRDFVRASLNISDEKNWVNTIQQGYFELHEALLNNIHFKPKGFPTKESVENRIQSLELARYRPLLKRIGMDFNYFEEHLITMAEHILKKLGYAGPEQTIYVIIGLDCTNIYSTELNGSPITVLCLEATDGDLDQLELLLSHECHHWRRQELLTEDIFNSSMGERLVSEGLASYFSEEVQPGHGISNYCYVPSSTVEWVKANWNLLRTIHNDLYESELTPYFFSRTPSKQLTERMPPRTGYVYGYLKVREYLSKTRKSAIEVAGIPWETLMGVDQS